MRKPRLYRSAARYEFASGEGGVGLSAEEGALGQGGRDAGDEEPPRLWRGERWLHEEESGRLSQVATARMSPLEEISSLLSGGGRVIVIAENEVDLKSLRGKNTLFLLKVAEGSLAAGGRGGGFGGRGGGGGFGFWDEEGGCGEIFEAAEEGTLRKFEV